MPITHELTVTFTHGRELASWAFDDCGTEKCCKVNEGDQIHFSFVGQGDVAECVILCGQMQNESHSSPFIEGNQVDLKKKSTLTVRDQVGLWGFSIAFTARNADATTSFYYVPDPEIEISTRPGSSD